MEIVVENDRIDTLDKDEKINIISQIKVQHPYYKKVMNEIEKCRVGSKIRKDPLSLIVTGRPGVGKTTIFTDYVEEKYESKLVGTGTKKNILWATLPTTMKPNALMSILLEQLGDRHPDKGTEKQKFKRLVELVKAIGVELIALDEFQHFINAKTKVPYKDVADWFKSFINHTSIPVVLFGIDDCLAVLEGNEQLGRRFKRRLELEPFQYKNKDDKENFKRLLGEVERQLPFEEPSNLKDMSDMIHPATMGIMDNIITLIREASYLAINRGDNCLTINHIYSAFKLDAHLNSIIKINPFEQY